MPARIAAGLLLCLGVAQAETGVEGLIHWLEKNGPELADTAGHCVEAMSMVKSLSEKCQTTKFDPEGMAGLAAWAVLEGLEHMQAPMAQEFVNSSLAKFYKDHAIKMVQSWTHRSLKEFCDGDCLNGLESFDTSYAKCYSSAICAAALSKEIPYDHCKKTMEAFMLRSMRIEQAMICSKSSMSDYFCAEERNTLLLQSPECYIRFMTPVLDERTCSAECVAEWSEARSLHPGCSSFLERQTQAVTTMTLEFMRELISGMKDPDMRKALDHLPKHFMTFQQACMGPATTMPPSLVV